MPATYGVLLVSFSRHSHQDTFVPLFRSHPRLRILAVSDEADIEPHLQDLNRKRAREIGVPYVEGVDEALEMEGVDIVSIGHEIERRSDLAVRAARAGKHLWIDKFMGGNLDECDAVVDAVARSGVRAIVPSYTYGTLVSRCRELIDSGDLGELLGVHSDILFCKGWPAPDLSVPDDFLPAGRWKFPDIKRELLTVGAYSVGLVQRCFGPIRQVLAHGGAHFFAQHTAHRAEDFATMTLVDAGGRVATLCAGRVGVATHAAGGPSRAWLVGSQRSALVDAKRPLLETTLSRTITASDYHPPAEDPMQWHTPSPTTASPLVDDPCLANGLEDLVAAIDEERRPLYSVAEARDHMEILLAGYRSIVENGPVSLLERGGS